MSRDTSCPAIATSPLVGSSRVPAIVSNVLFPDPLGPITATSSPASTPRSTSRKACTSFGPDPKTFDIARSSRAGVIVGPLSSDELQAQP